MARTPLSVQPARDLEVRDIVFARLHLAEVALAETGPLDAEPGLFMPAALPGPALFVFALDAGPRWAPLRVADAGVWRWREGGPPASQNMMNA